MVEEKWRNALEGYNTYYLPQMTLGEVTYPNYFFAASSPVGKTLEQFLQLKKAGLGAIITKTISEESTTDAVNSQRGLSTDSHTGNFNAGSTAKEMFDLETSIDNMTAAIKQGVPIIPNLTSKRIFDAAALHFDSHEAFKTFQDNLSLILDGSIFNRIVDNNAYSRLVNKFGNPPFDPATKELFIKTQLYGMADLLVWHQLLSTVGKWKKRLESEGFIKGMNLELNLRYLARSTERIDWEPVHLWNKKLFDRQMPQYDDAFLKKRATNIDEYVKDDFRTGKSIGRRGIDIVDTGYLRKSALHRSLYALNIIAKQYGLGLIGKFSYSDEIIELAKTCDEAGFVGMTLINTHKTSPRWEYFRDDAPPYIFKSKEMQTAGNPIREMARLSLSRVYPTVKLKLLASGGVAMDLVREDKYRKSYQRLKREYPIKSKEDLSYILETALKSDYDENMYPWVMEKEKAKFKRWIEQRVSDQGLSNTERIIREFFNVENAVDNVLDRRAIGADGIELGSVLIGPRVISHKLADFFKAYNRRLTEIKTAYVLYSQLKNKDFKKSYASFSQEKKKAISSFVGKYNLRFNAFGEPPDYIKRILDTSSTNPLVSTLIDKLKGDVPLNEIELQKKVSDAVISVTSEHESQVLIDYLDSKIKGLIHEGGFLSNKNVYGEVVAEFNADACPRSSTRVVTGNCPGDCYNTDYGCFSIHRTKEETGHQIPEIITDACTGCKTCVDACAFDALKLVIKRPDH
ncbi:MAG: ferredoxin family protein [DPANN group archaeon]|nr:ferredoxin family protein [DPANN group archaeon]